MASIIGHHCKISDICFISSSVIAGECEFEKKCFYWKTLEIIFLKNLYDFIS